jgi:hypothetical protein
MAALVANVSLVVSYVSGKLGKGSQQTQAAHEVTSNDLLPDHFGMLDTIFPFLRSRPGLIVIPRAHQNSNSPEIFVYQYPGSRMNF